MTRKEFTGDDHFTTNKILPYGGYVQASYVVSSIGNDGKRHQSTQHVQSFVANAKRSKARGIDDARKNAVYRHLAELYNKGKGGISSEELASVASSDIYDQEPVTITPLYTARTPPQIAYVQDTNLYDYNTETWEKDGKERYVIRHKKGTPRGGQFRRVFILDKEEDINEYV